MLELNAGRFVMLKEVRKQREKKNGNVSHSAQVEHDIDGVVLSGTLNSLLGLSQ
jgi:hypothetical protein